MRIIEVLFLIIMKMIIKIFNNDDREKIDYRFSNNFKNGYNISGFNENNDYVTYNKENDN